MSYQKKIFIVLLCTMLLMAFCVTGALASSGVKVLNNEKFTTSTGIVKAANASSLGQSAMAVRRGADGGGYGVFYPT